MSPAILCRICLLTILLTVFGRAYRVEELNSVTLILEVKLEDYKEDAKIKDTLFQLIANATTANCSFTRQNCKLVPKYYRKSGLYKRNMTSKDYVFTSNFISELKAAENSEDYNLQNSSDPATKIIFNLRTYTGYDYLKWTEIVRIVYYSKQLINKIYREETGFSEDILVQNPTSYIAKVIGDNKAAPAALACALLGAAILLFIVLVPLSNSKYCRKDKSDDIEDKVVSSHKGTVSGTKAGGSMHW